MRPDPELTAMNDAARTEPHDNAVAADELTSQGAASPDARRRAAMAKLGRMAAIGSPVLMTLMMSERAAADSPPADPSAPPVTGF
jgi:hypothetical protein